LEIWQRLCCPLCPFCCAAVGAQAMPTTFCSKLLGRPDSHHGWLSQICRGSMDNGVVWMSRCVQHQWLAVPSLQAAGIVSFEPHNAIGMDDQRALSDASHMPCRPLVAENQHLCDVRVQHPHNMSHVLLLEDAHRNIKCPSPNKRAALVQGGMEQTANDTSLRPHSLDSCAVALDGCNDNHGPSSGKPTPTRIECCLHLQHAAVFRDQQEGVPATNHHPAKLSFMDGMVPVTWTPCNAFLEKC